MYGEGTRDTDPWEPDEYASDEHRCGEHVYANDETKVVNVQSQMTRIICM